MGQVTPLQLVAELSAAGKVDTVYRDLYLDRARAVLGSVLSPDQLRMLENQQRSSQELPLKIQQAVESGRWTEVKELTERLQALRLAVKDNKRVIDIGRDVYAVSDIALDPFSPGLYPFTGVSPGAMAGLREQTIARLAALARTDPDWRDFYGGRHKAFETLDLTAFAETPEGAPQKSQMTAEAAMEALKSGDMARLQAVADAMISGQLTTTGARRPEATTAPTAPQADLSFAFSERTLDEAGRLGLAARHLVAHPEITSLRAYAWHPVFSDTSGRIRVEDIPLPEKTDDAIRQRLEMFMIHPMVNSGGARHLPPLGAEDVLVESFPDPADDKPMSGSPLLEALGLPGRRGVSRDAIEQALLLHGTRVIEQELKLDPRAFRLICIPPDVHLRLGQTEGWGRQAVWTHFDGYLVLANGRLRALAGGDVRYGGIYHIFAVSRDYDSEKLVVRFAVVRRERMASW